MIPEYNPNDYNAVISRIDVSLKNITDKLTAIETSVNANVIQVEKRLTLLEQFKWKLIGISTGITSIFATLVHYFTNKQS
jgi:hypothetical protein